MKWAQKPYSDSRWRKLIFSDKNRRLRSIYLWKYFSKIYQDWRHIDYSNYDAILLDDCRDKGEYIPYKLIFKKNINYDIVPEDGSNYTNYDEFQVFALNTIRKTDNIILPYFFSAINFASFNDLHPELSLKAFFFGGLILICQNFEFSLL